MKKLFYISLATFGIAACSTKIDSPVSPDNKGEMETSYIAVTLKSDDMGTRAGEEEYEYGSKAERYVQSAHFFLFKGDGTAFSVNAEGNNYLSLAMNPTGTQPDETGNPSEGPNVSDVKDKVLVFNNYKGEYPTHIVAVLNWDVASPKTAYSLSDLTDYLSGLKNASGRFVMSNSVYADMQGKVINANVLSIDNIGKTEAQAKANPVNIYVERVSAKVELVAKGNVTGKENTFDINQSVNETPVYVKVLGWDVYNDYQNSFLLKHIYPDTWKLDGTIGFLWNDPNRFRSYWASSTVDPFPNNDFSWNGLSLNPTNGVAYCGENTRQVVKDAAGNITLDPRTKLIIKAQLVKTDGSPLEIARWYGYEYIGEEAVRTEVANLLSSEVFYKDGDEYKSICGDDLKVVEADEAPEGTDIEAYEVFFQLSDAGLAKDWYTYSQAGEFQTASDDAVNAILAAVEPAVLYNDGMTYYHTDIKHLGETDSATEFGIIRNHIYKVNVSQVKGFGTPVFDPQTEFQIPERPAETTTYVAAEVRVLAWRVVKHNYSVE